MSKYSISYLQQNARNKLDYTQTNLKVFVDNREKSSEVSSELRKWGIKVAFYNLAAGDYILSRNCAIERKTFRDYCRSLNDGRLFDQAVNLSSSFNSPYIILEEWSLYGSPRASPWTNVVHSKGVTSREAKLPGIKTSFIPAQVRGVLFALRSGINKTHTQMPY